MLVVRLVKKDIFTIPLSAFCPFFQLTLRRDPMLCTQLLPELDGISYCPSSSQLADSLDVRLKWRK